MPLKHQDNKYILDCSEIGNSLHRRSMVATNSLTHKAHGIWSATPHQIKELDTRSKFKRSLKREMLTKLHM